VSRHTLHQGKKRIVVGYDRPLNNWFLQLWGPKGKSPMDSEIHHTTETLIVSAKQKGFELPAELCVLLEEEAAGLAETNTCRTWP
jgi:hypothetical protein